MIRKVLAAMVVLALFLPASRSQTPDAPAPPRPAITGLGNVAIWVKDVETSRQFYKNYLGYAEPYSLTTPSGAPRLAWIKINDRQAIELLPIADRTSEGLNGLSVAYFSLATVDAQAMRDYLAAKGVKAPGGKELPAKVSIGETGDPHFFIEDTAGHVVEFIQYTPDGWTRKDQGQSLPDTRISIHLTHAGIAITGPNTLWNFYCDVLGFKPIHRARISGGTLRVPEGDEWLELMHSSPERLPRINHLCLGTPDLAQAVATLQGRTCPAGAKVPEAIRPGTDGKLQSSCFDPDGTRVELMEPTARK